MTRFISLLVAALFALSVPVFAQTNINLGGLSADPTAPVEIAAESLTVDQDTGTAVFEGEVVIVQGDLRLLAQRVEVVYGATAVEIVRLRASGGVVFATATEAAEATTADYDITNGTLELSGNVLLTQGPSAISAEQIVINLITGNAQLSGRVRSVLQQGGN